MEADYRFFCPITTRWNDNDVYGHVNNVAYYSYFDSAANLYLIRECGLDVVRSPAIALVVSSSCEYHAPLAYPDELRAGVRIDRLGEKSVTWAIAIFRAGEANAAASGKFVHVFVDRMTRKSVPIPDSMRAPLARLVVSAG
ncbi:thioesterase family protein [soil metagenome]